MDRAINRQPVAALVRADCASRAAADYAIDRARVITGARESALYLDDQRAVHAITAALITVSVIATLITVSAVSVWVVGIRVIERKERRTEERRERKSEVIENNDLVAKKPIISIEVAVVESVEGTKPI